MRRRRKAVRMFPAGPAKFATGFRVACCQCSASSGLSSAERGCDKSTGLFGYRNLMGSNSKVLLDTRRVERYYFLGVIIMPSDKKRINLTVPDGIYEKLQMYKEENGISNDATACLQLIVQQLKSQENSKIMLKLLQESSVEQLVQMSNQGISTVKEELQKNK